VNLLQAEKRLSEDDQEHAAALQSALAEMLKRFDPSGK
jgi:hypothetical protein